MTQRKFQNTDMETIELTTWEQIRLSIALEIFTEGVAFEHLSDGLQADVKLIVEKIKIK